MDTDRSPYEVLVDAALLKSFRGNQEELDDYLEQHRVRDLNPYGDCGDNTCRWAREYAVEVLEILKANQLGVGRVFYVTQQAFDELQERLERGDDVGD